MNKKKIIILKYNFTTKGQLKKELIPKAHLFFQDGGTGLNTIPSSSFADVNFASQLANTSLQSQPTFSPFFLHCSL